jgi:hypothetical protein
MPCREIKSTAIYAKKDVAPYSATLNACKIPSDEWKITS